MDVLSSGMDMELSQPSPPPTMVSTKLQSLDNATYLGSGKVNVGGHNIDSKGSLQQEVPTGPLTFPILRSNTIRDKLDI